MICSKLPPEIYIKITVTFVMCEELLFLYLMYLYK